MIDGEPIPTIFPKMIEETLVGGSTILKDTITIKATNQKNNNIITFLDIEVVPTVGDFALYMNSQVAEDDVEINKDKNR